MKEELYKEVGNNYRFFLRWRHAAFAGYLVVVWAALSLCISAYKDDPSILWLITLFAAPIGLILWVIDTRTRDAYHAAIKAGKGLESPDTGFYTQLSNDVTLGPDTSPFDKKTQSAALNIMFIGGSIVFFVFSVFLFVAYVYPELLARGEN